MKWPWTKTVTRSEHQKRLLEEVRQERGNLAVTAVSVENATSDIRKAFGLDELVKRTLTEIHRGSIR